MQVKDKGIICRRIPYSETSWILKVFTPQYGMMSFIAKGARRQKSAFAGKTELFTIGEFQWYSSSGEMHTLTEVSSFKHQNLTYDLEAHTLASAVVELALKTHSIPRPDQEFFETVKTALQYLASPPSGKIDNRFLARFLLKTLESEGHGIQTDRCFQCGESVKKIGVFSTENGAFGCHNCYPVSKESIKGESLFNFVTRKVNSNKTHEIYFIEKQLIDFLSYHIGAEIRLKSFEFLTELRGD